MTFMRQTKYLFLWGKYREINSSYINYETPIFPPTNKYTYLLGKILPIS